MTLAAIDVGTNSVKLLVGRVEGTAVTPLLHRSINTRLGEGLHASGIIAPGAADRTVAALKELRELAVGRGAGRVAAVGTLVLRSASNAAAFLERCRTEAGLDVRILTGEEEARLSFQGASWAAAVDHVLAIDIGGGSTEIMVGTRTGLTASWSLPIGAVTMTEEFLRTDPPAATEMLNLSAEIRRHLIPVVARAGREGELVGVGGTVSSILALLRKELGEDPREIHRKTVAFDTISALAIHLSLKTVAVRERMGLERGRADIIVAGAWILVAAMSHLEASTLRATTHGLRHGLLIELASGRWQ
jgi:exopolyphosphatase/guanosine-5'-triphosphate,3'-diphosphate pyrophosphatase